MLEPLFHKSNLHKKSLIALFSAIVLLISGCSKQMPNTAPEQLWGQVDATEVDMNSKVAGRVVELFVEEGTEVKKGQILARIDDRELTAKHSQAEAQLRAAKAQAMQAKANLELAETDSRRYDALYKQGAVSSQVFDSTNTKYAVASATYRQYLEEIAAAEDQIKQISVNVDDTLIKAPFDGIITTKYVNVGAIVSTGMPIVAVQNPLDNWVNIKVNETDLAKYFVGQKITLEGRNAENKIEGIVVSISKKPEFATRRATSERSDANDIITFNVKVQINSEQIRPGMRYKIIESDAKA